MRPIPPLALAALVLCAAGASADTPIALTVSGNQATGAFELPGAIGADLTISFEQVVGLNPAALEVSVRLASPLEPELLARLPGPGVGLPVAFPVVLRIDPSEASALSFQGVVAVSLHTHNLHLETNSPLALHSASGGGPFRDITRSVGIGSYRAGGSSGGFSEFLIMADTRPIDAVIGGKFDRLQANLADNAASMPAPVLSDLQARLGQARTLWSTGATVAAIGEVTAFADAVKAQSGAAIPDVWRAHDSRVNVAGTLRAGAETLRFSLNVKSTRSP